MNDLKLILSYEIKMKIREIKSMVKNLLIGLILAGGVFLYVTFLFAKVIILNLEIIHTYNNQIFLAISIIIILFTLIYKKTPLEWHPASMIYLSGFKFSSVLKISLLKKVSFYFALSILMALILNEFKIDFKTIQIILSFYNLFILSLTSRYYIYNKDFNMKILIFILIYILVLNIQLYVSKVLSIILILILTYMSILAFKNILNINFDFDKSFTEMAYINRAKFLARGNIIEDTQEFVREASAEKSRKNILLKNIEFKNPLIQKNLITFSRINLGISVYIFAIFTGVVLLYRFEIFEFIKTIKALGIGIPIVAMHQALFINNIIELITSQKNLLVEKAKKGLYLPYKEYEINKSFILIGISIILLATLMTGIILQKPIWTIVLAVLLYSIVLFISLNFERKKKKDFFITFIYLVIIGVSYLFI